ncbi:MAG: hypothetical protein NTV61_09980 [Candidatus Bathyarchaeota archaeon]|nr:hypothetical protein [Candidatus Bathyarchaeota archaeon]
MASREKLGNILSVLGLVLVFAALTLAFGPYVAPGDLFLWPKDTPHWVGWLALLLLAGSTILSALPRSGKWLRGLHCELGGFSLIAALYHVNARLNPYTGTPIGFWIIRPVHYSAVFMLALLAVIVVSGVVRRLRPDNMYVKLYGRALHLPFTAAFIIMLSFHVLQKTGIL